MIRFAIQRRRAASGQDGYALIAALSMMAVIGASMLALLGSTVGRGDLAGDLAASHQRLRAADSALSEVVQIIRTDVGSDLQECPQSTTSGPFTYVVQEELRDGSEIEVVVTCTTTIDADERVVDLEAVVDGGDIPSGRARIQYLDTIGALKSPGFTMMICDWQLGVGASNLAACP